MIRNSSRASRLRQWTTRILARFACKTSFPASPVRPGSIRFAGPTNRPAPAEILDELRKRGRQARRGRGAGIGITRSASRAESPGPAPRPCRLRRPAAERALARRAPGSPCNSRSTTRKAQNIPTATATTERRLASPKLPGGRVPAGQRDLAFETMYEFGSRVGVWRLFRLFRGAGPARSQFLAARSRWSAIRGSPRRSRAAGYDVCCHGWRWEEHFRLSEDEERERIARAIDSIKRTTGERPLGWYCRYGPSENTRRLLVEEGGFLYDSDAYNDELPYWVEVARQAASRRALHDGRQRREICARRRLRRHPRTSNPISRRLSISSTRRAPRRPR